MIKFKRLAKSFKYALSGLKKVWLEEQNFQVHSIITVIVLVLAWYFQIAIWQLIILILLIALVLILEIINSIMERFIDLLKPRIHEYVKDIKDMGAALVFVGAITAVIVGLMIFLPYFIALLS
ncbi:MAG: diacylglycerol kinase [Candidatus Buchananbacteria bacterium]|nr:diacylglycerol kinase [Candidatus Buchananbacteria bacterium]